MQQYDEKPSSSNMAAMPWAPKPPKPLPATSCAAGADRDQSGGRAWRRAGRDHAQAARHQSESRSRPRIDAATIEIVEMVLAGSVNKQLVGYINEAGGKAVGLSGKDLSMVKASKTTRTVVDPDPTSRSDRSRLRRRPRQGGSDAINQLIGYELIPCWRCWHLA
jgi:hypothetical protein